MSDKSYMEEALYRFQIIAPLLNGRFAKGELKKKFHEAASKYYEHPHRGWEKFSPRTIEDWYYNYRSEGFSALERSRRSDRGKSRSISPEIGELILAMKKENPRRSGCQIIKELTLAGRIIRGELSRSSVYRLLAQHQHILKQHRKEKKQIRKFSFEFSNECWQSDICHGPYLKFDGSGKKKKIYLYAFLDDATRLIPHACIAHAENLETFLEALKTAVLKRGIPQRLYLDNASYFRSPVVKIIGGRIGTKMIYCTPYSPYKKGKIERFWRRVRDQLLIYLDRTKQYTIEELNRLFLNWIEKDYHQSVHASLGKTPLEVWQERAALPIRYPDAQALEEDFLAEAVRKVRNDGTFSLNGTLYEIDSIFAGEAVAVRYNPYKRQKVYVYVRGEKIAEASHVDETENRWSPRRTISVSDPVPSTGINFIDLLGKEENDDV